ncbi:hypothetical protein EYF80_025652 [Liparis tanakae]|uniref:Uncharacterized protein n=1 Tax=Liparis tanakae TaxID=230148 RepID=A0A4Z2HGX8_9TELE|nr:hypothetical protein EYF80_025652 [Liparis tanakae]
MKHASPSYRLYCQKVVETLLVDGAPLGRTLGSVHGSGFAQDVLQLPQGRQDVLTEGLTHKRHKQCTKSQGYTHKVARTRGAYRCVMTEASDGSKSLQAAEIKDTDKRPPPCSYRGQPGLHGVLQVLDHLLQQQRTLVELVAIHRRLQEAGKLLPRSRKVAGLERRHPPRLPHAARVQAALGRHLTIKTNNQSQ